jgi:hypothetical protein
MKQTIKRWTDDSAIYEGEHDTFKEAVEHCVKNDIDLSEADLSSANLSRANLVCADLSSANLRWANLVCADLRWANLRWANIDKKWCITTISPIGSENGHLCTIDNQDGKGIIYNRGCFSGTEAEFIAAIAKKHGGTAIEREYLAAIAFVKANFGVEEVER